MANEASKVLPRIQKLIAKGNGVDLGCGPFKIADNCNGVDTGDYDGVYKDSVLSFLEKRPVGSFDWVFSSHYLEHEPNARGVLQEVFRTLKPGGRAIFYLPDRSVYKDALGKDPNATHVNQWTCGEFVDYVHAHTGFTVDVAERRNTTPEGHVFTGNGDTENPDTQAWEYSFLVVLIKPKS